MDLDCENYLIWLLIEGLVTQLTWTPYSWWPFAAEFAGADHSYGMFLTQYLRLICIYVLAFCLHWHLEQCQCTSNVFARTPSYTYRTKVSGIVFLCLLKYGWVAFKQEVSGTSCYIQMASYTMLDNAGQILSQNYIPMLQCAAGCLTLQLLPVQGSRRSWTTGRCCSLGESAYIPDLSWHIDSRGRHTRCMWVAFVNTEHGSESAGPDVNCRLPRGSLSSGPALRPRLDEAAE